MVSHAVAICLAPPGLKKSHTVPQRADGTMMTLWRWAPHLFHFRDTGFTSTIFIPLLISILHLPASVNKYLHFHVTTAWKVSRVRSKPMAFRRDTVVTVPYASIPRCIASKVAKGSDFGRYFIASRTLFASGVNIGWLIDDDMMTDFQLIDGEVWPPAAFIDHWLFRWSIGRTSKTSHHATILHFMLSSFMKMLSCWHTLQKACFLWWHDNMHTEATTIGSLCYADILTT